jgi:hypothetical protein
VVRIRPSTVAVSAASIREEFLAAVTGTPESVESAKEVVSTRLESG